jgi:hypothetical protein
MAVLTHPSMSKGTPINQAPKAKEPEPVVVEDLSQFGASPEPQVQAAPTLKDQLQEADRKQLDDLIFVGRIAKDVELVGHTFELTTLTHKEHTLLMRELAKVSDTANLFVVRAYTLALSVKKIDGKALDEFQVEGSFESPFARKVEVIDSMQLRVIEKLFDEYSLLSDASDKLVTSDNLKKS